MTKDDRSIPNETQDPTLMTTPLELKEELKLQLLEALPGVTIENGTHGYSLLASRGEVNTGIYLSCRYESNSLFRKDRGSPLGISEVVLDRLFAPKGFDDVRRKTIKPDKNGVIPIKKVASGILQRLDASAQFSEVLRERADIKKLDQAMLERISAHIKGRTAYASVSSGMVSVQVPGLTEKEAISVVEAVNLALGAHNRVNE